MFIKYSKIVRGVIRIKVYKTNTCKEDQSKAQYFSFYLFFKYIIKPARANY